MMSDNPLTNIRHAINALQLAYQLAQNEGGDEGARRMLLQAMRDCTNAIERLNNRDATRVAEDRGREATTEVPHAATCECGECNARRAKEHDQ